MRRIASFALGFALFAPLLMAAPANAQATRTWVSGVGDDANPCSRTAPCKTFAGAISKTAASGEINCLDPAGFGAVTITKSISIVCHHTLGGILSAGTTGVIINALASDKVVLKGLDINGVNTGISGIRALSVGALTVEDTTIANVSQWGIQINNTALNTFQISRVTVTNAVLGGVQIRPANAGAVAVGIVTGLISFKNGKGIEIDGNGGSTSRTIIDRSSFNSNTTGISLVTGGTALSAMASNSLVQNSTTGISAGANTSMKIGTMSIEGNTTGVSGNVSSFGTNQIRDNSTDGTVTLLVPALQ
ncbi:MAG: right-handed parallel beta-helix repeat-containing protein [Bradyrhizobium sp.]